MTQTLLYPYRPISRWLFPARYMTALLGLLLLVATFRWAYAVAGPIPALVVLALTTFDPNLLAHSAVATTDVGATLLMILGLWQGTRFLRSPNRKRALTTGLLLGAALGAKLTALLLGPALGLSGLFELVSSQAERRRRLVRLGLGILALTGLTLWAIYGFGVGKVPGFPLPVPAPAHVVPFLRLRSHNQGGHQAYLLGQNSNFGWWHYFPVAFLLKTPLPALLLILVALPWAGWAGGRGDPGTTHEPDTPATEQTSPASRLTRILTPSLLFASVYVTASMLSSLNIGYRHLLPLLPLLYVGVGQGIGVILGTVSQVRQKTAVRRPVVIGSLALLCLWQMSTSVIRMPYLISYFNVLAGGPENGWRFLADSNTDWGQGYKALAHYQEEREIGTVNLAAFIFYDPAIYGIDYRPLTPLGGDTPAIFPSRFAPAPGEYVISATPLDGIPTADPAMYDWFRWREPEAYVADALLHYHVTESDTETAWVAQCTAPTAPLDERALAFGFGELPARRIPFDCTEAWIIPSQETGGGAYILHGALVKDTLRARLHLAPPPAVDAFVRQRLTGADVTYRQRLYRNNPAFVIYRASDGSTKPPQTRVWTAPAAEPLSDIRRQTSGRAPVPLDGPLTFLGAAGTLRDDKLDIETWWRVTASPDPERPVSIMGHLLNASGEAVEVADGLGVPVPLWSQGDVIVQRHSFTSDEVEFRNGLVLRTGVYELADGRRWPITGQGDADVILVPIEVGQGK
jgi:hypothetical protein